MMNDLYYTLGNQHEVNSREHYCYKCNTRLYIIKHFKVVSRRSVEAKYYDFSDPMFGTVIGPCRFIHEVFYCPECKQNIEFVTQLNQENIDIYIKKTEQYFLEKGREIHIRKCFEDTDGGIKERCDVDSAKYLCFFIEEDGKVILIYKVPKSREDRWERPVYFRIIKRKFIRLIKNAGA